MYFSFSFLLDRILTSDLFVFYAVRTEIKVFFFKFVCVFIAKTNKDARTNADFLTDNNIPFHTVLLFSKNTMRIM